jgi:predicted membrane metal-binding protein
MASRNFHESFERPELPLPSDRSTGLVFAGIAAIVGYSWRADAVVMYSAAFVAGLLIVISILAPRLLRPLNIIWMRFALLLSKIVNPVVMFVVFALVIVPAGLIMRLRHDPLHKFPDQRAKSYWIARHSTERSSMRNQF